MNRELDLTAVAHLVGDPSRLKMLVALLAEDELTAGELAVVAGVSAQTTSAHLGKLQQGGLIRRAHSALGAYGFRNRVFRLMDGDVAGAVAALSTLAPAESVGVPTAARQDAKLCYGHLGGTLGHALLAALLEQKLLKPGTPPSESFYDYQVTAEGAEVLGEFGIDLTGLQKQRRYFAKQCLNAHMANAHLSGSLAEALLKGLLGRGWLKPDDSRDRVLVLTEAGKDGLTSHFAVRL